MRDNRTRKVTIEKNGEILEFNSLGKCAKYLNCLTCQISAAYKLVNKVRGWNILNVELVDLEYYRPPNRKHITITDGNEILGFESISECADFLGLSNRGLDYYIKENRYFEKNGWKIVEIDGIKYNPIDKKPFVPTRNNKKTVTIYNDVIYKKFETMKECSLFLNKTEDYITNMIARNSNIDSRSGWKIVEINDSKYFSKYYYKDKANDRN